MKINNYICNEKLSLEINMNMNINYYNIFHQWYNYCVYNYITVKTVYGYFQLHFIQ